jgi:predicted lipoprotein with Yx(FWY)xxD motif
MRHPRITIAAIAVALAATIAGITAAASATSTNSHAASGPSSSAAPGAPGDPATVQTRSASVQGMTETILVDAQGLPLYIYKPDTPATSHVTGQLAALWPPLVAAAPTDRGVSGRLASVATTNGKQVSYNGHFLYTFVEDRPGKVTGQGVQNFFVATPNLAAGAPSSVSSSSQSSSAKTSYGY